MRLLSTILVLGAAGCSYDLSLGSQGGNGQDAGQAAPQTTVVDAGPGPIVLPGGVTYMRAEVGYFLLDGSDIVTGVQRELRRVHANGSFEVIATIVEGRLEAHAQDASHFYLVHQYTAVITPANDTATRQAILAVDKATAEVLILASNWENIERLIVDADAIYFDVNRPPASLEPYEPNGLLIRLDKSTGQTRVLYEGLRSPLGLHADEDFVYVADDAHHRVLAVPKSGARAFEIAREVNRPSAILISGEWLYFTERGSGYTDGKVSRVRRPTTSSTGPSVVETIASGLAAPSELAIDESRIYWTSYFFGLESAPHAGGGWSRIVPTPDQGNGPMAMATDRIYFPARAPDAMGPIVYIVDTTMLP